MKRLTLFLFLISILIIFYFQKQRLFQIDEKFEVSDHIDSKTSNTMSQNKDIIWLDKYLSVVQKDHKTSRQIQIGLGPDGMFMYRYIPNKSLFSY